MAEKTSRWQRFKARVQHTYRLIILNNETLEEVNSFNLTLLNLYVAICSFIVLGALLLFFLISFTPLKRMVPGYGELSSNRELMYLYKKVDTLELLAQSQQLYIDNFRHYVTGDLPQTLDSSNADAEIIPEQPIERIREDEILRKEIQLEQDLRLADREERTNKDKKLEHIHMVSPIKGTISTSFRPDIDHYGVDVLGPSNTAIKAVMAGIVISADWTLDAGNTLAIQHHNNVISFYKHNSRLLKHLGDEVAAGEAIAIIGNSGTLSDGPHLHFEIWHDGVPLDPEKYIVFQ